MGILSLLTFLPVAFALIIWFLPKDRLVRPLALAFTVFEFLLSLILIFNFDKSSASLQFVESIPWVSNIGVTYFMGIDGLSLWLVILTTFLTPITILGSWTAITKKTKGFHISLLLLQTAMIGTFCAMDAVLFYVFFEISLLPMYFMIGIWGGENRFYATLKFFIYTMFGSVLMLLSIIALMFMTEDQTGTMSASLIDIYNLKIPFVAGEFLSTQSLLFMGFALAFAIKVPLFPFHTWLPDAHVQAPTPGSVILAGVMLKMGTYGLLRFCLPIFPEATAYWGWLFLLLAVIGIIYGALVAMVQPDMKKLVAYSSVSHMGYVVLGLFTLNAYGVAGGIFQMLSHGVSTGALFLLVGMIYERTHSREISKYGGLAVVAPIFTVFFFIVTLASIGVPLTNGFVGEFLILMGAFTANKVFAVFAVLGVILGATYMLWMVKKIFFGAPGELVINHKDSGLDINTREIATLVPIIIVIFWMGIFPGHFLSYTQASVDHFVKNKSQYYLTVKDGEAADVANEEQ